MLALALLTASGPMAFAGQKTVCTITLNSTQEQATFKKFLSPKDFKFIELTDFDPGHIGTDRVKSQWFKKACDAKLQCDIIVSSAHFGGLFWGISGYQLGMDAIEQNSCSNTCDGILKHPKEVFLFGCNTLADKGRDSRTQAAYAQVLVDHGQPRTMADRNAETRYGAVGSTFESRMRRAFAGVPHIYGFDSTSPSGAHVQPALEQYFKSMPDYATYLEGAGSSAAPNQNLAKALAETSFQQTSGVGINQNDTELPYRQQICTTYDLRLTLEERTKHVVQMMTSTDRFIYLDVARNFFNQNLAPIKIDQFATSALKKLTSDQPTLEALETLRTSSTTSVTLQLDLLHLQSQLGLRSKADFEEKSLAMLRPLVKNLTSSNSDLLCSSLYTHDLHIKVGLEDFKDRDLQSVSLLYALECLDTDDARITAAVLPLADKIRAANSGSDMRAYLLALSRLPGNNAEKIRRADQIDRWTTMLETYTLGLRASAESGEAQLATVQKLLARDIYELAFVFNMYLHMPRTSGLPEAILKNLNTTRGDETFGRQVLTIARLLPESSPAWSDFTRTIQSLEPNLRAMTLGIIGLMPVVPQPIVNLSITLVQANQQYPLYSAWIVAKAKLNLDQIAAVYLMIETNPDSGAASLARWILSQQPRESLPKNIRSWISGHAFSLDCQPALGTVQCSGEPVWLK